MSESAVERVGGLFTAYAAFREAVLDLSDAPTKANIVRYLNASKLLDGELSRNGAGGRTGRNRKRSSQ